MTVHVDRVAPEEDRDQIQGLLRGGKERDQTLMSVVIFTMVVMVLSSSRGTMAAPHGQALT